MAEVWFNVVSQGATERPIMIFATSWLQKYYLPWVG